MRKTIDELKKILEKVRSLESNSQKETNALAKLEIDVRNTISEISESHRGDK